MPGTATRTVNHHNDRRSRRTRQALSQALVDLMLEKRYDTITVQEIIDRANTGRSTFYAHYMDKEDLLQNQVADLVARLTAHMDISTRGSGIVPSRELLHHLAESSTLINALVRGRAIEPVLKTMQSQLSLQAEIRLAGRMRPGLEPAMPLPVVAQYVAGVLLTLFQWWLDRG